MISLQEVLGKTEKQRRDIRDVMDGGAGFHPEDASIYTGQNLDDYYKIKETLRAVSVRKLIEFLGKGTTLGNYLIADKIHDDLVFYVSQTDIAPLINAQVVEGWTGADLIVNVVDDESYKPHFTVAGAISPAETVNATKCTLTPKTFTVAMPIGMDLEEDTGYALVDYHVEQAAKAVGRLSTSMMLEVLLAPPDGVGTANTLAGAADETTYAHVLNAMSLNGDDLFISDTMVMTLEAWRHSCGATAAGIPGVMGPEVPPGYHINLQQLNVRFCCDPLLHLSTDVAGAVMTKCKTIVFDKKAALLTGRKRWMQLENYVDPVRDIAGAVVSCRQDSVTLYKDAGCVITEA